MTTGYRTAQRSALTSKKLRRCSDPAERLFWRLVLAVDSYGTASADPEDVLHDAMRGAAGWDEAQVADALDHLEALGLVVRWRADDLTPWLHVVDFEAHQLANFLRKRGKRTTPMPPHELVQHARTLGLPHAAPAAPQNQNQKKNQNHRDIALSELVQAAPRAAQHDGEGEAQQVVHLEPRQQQRTTERTSAIQQVFDHWKQAGGPLQPSTVKLTEDRRRKIGARLAEGYTVQQLTTAVDGFLADPWHTGSNPGGKRYTDLTTLLKNAAKVDAGLALAAQARKAAEQQQVHDEYTRPAFVVGGDEA